VLPDVEAFAAEVALIVNAAVSPLLERLTVAETRLAAIGDVRDRVLTIEAKSVSPAGASDVDDIRARVLGLETRIPVDQSLERVAAVEAKVAAIGDLRDRVIAVETKTSTPPAPDAALADVRDRVLMLETKAAAPVAADVAVADLRERFAAFEQRVHDNALAKDVGALRERVAVVEVRQPIPGPAGKDGSNGADGLGFEDIDVQFDGDRTIELKFARGTLKKSFPIVLPFMRQQGVWDESKGYRQGDVVTWGGAQWHAETDTAAKPGDGSKGWKLIVKKGQDGRDGKDAPGALPVVSIGGGSKP
jgi:hypothetical protein